MTKVIAALFVAATVTTGSTRPAVHDAAPAASSVSITGGAVGSQPSLFAGESESRVPQANSALLPVGYYCGHCYFMWDFQTWTCETQPRLPEEGCAVEFFGPNPWCADYTIEGGCWDTFAELTFDSVGDPVAKVEYCRRTGHPRSVLPANHRATVVELASE